MHAMFYRGLFARRYLSDKEMDVQCAKSKSSLHDERCPQTDFTPDSRTSRTVAAMQYS